MLRLFNSERVIQAVKKLNSRAVTGKHQSCMQISVNKKSLAANDKSVKTTNLKKQLLKSIHSLRKKSQMKNGY